MIYVLVYLPFALLGWGIGSVVHANRANRAPSTGGESDHVSWSFTDGAEVPVSDKPLRRSSAPQTRRSPPAP